MEKNLFIKASRHLDAKAHMYQLVSASVHIFALRVPYDQPGSTCSEAEFPNIIHCGSKKLLTAPGTGQIDATKNEHHGAS